MPITNSSPWIALLGVALGFMLGEGSRYAKYRLQIRRNRGIVGAELRSVLAQLPQKRDILNQAIGHLRKERFMPTLSVRMVATGYHSVLEDLYPHLRPLERNCLHVVFERLRVADDQLDQFEDIFVSALKDKIVSNPWVTYRERLEQLAASYLIVEELAHSYLAGAPIDVFQVGKSA